MIFGEEESEPSERLAQVRRSLIRLRAERDHRLHQGRLVTPWVEQEIRRLESEEEDLVRHLRAHPEAAGCGVHEEDKFLLRVGFVLLGLLVILGIAAWRQP